MKVAFLTGSISREAGGFFHSVRQLARGLSCSGDLDLTVHSLRDRWTDEDILEWAPEKPRIHEIQGPRAFGYSRTMQVALLQADYDIVHTSGLWQNMSRIALSWHRKTGRPHIISPRGMLDPWALNNSRWKKRIAAVFFEDRHLSEAACIHALCQSELESIRAYGLRNPVAIIPNGVALPEKKLLKAETLKAENKTLLFLGRLHPKKGLIPAIEAWAAARHSEWQLVIAGWDQGGHEAELRRLCKELRLTVGSRRSPEEPAATPQAADVVFHGPAFGAEKDSLLRSADAFILPSLSEGLPMSVLEAWAYGLPVLMTPECNLPEGFAHGAAIQIASPGNAEKLKENPPMTTTRPAIEDGLRAIFEMSDADRSAMGARGRRLVEERFTWPRVATQMKEVYDWVLGGGPQPACVE